MYEEQLKELGLTENEIKIYLLLLRNGAMKSSEIAQSLGFHRGYIYDTLERMKEKEVINFSTVDNKRFFNASRPDNLLELLRFKIEKFKEITPKLMVLVSKKEDLKVEVYKGKKAYRTLLADMINNLKKNQEILFVGIDEDILLTEVEPLYFKQFLNIMKSKNVKERMIIKEGARKLKFSNMQHRTVDKKYVGDTMEIIYNNKVATFILEPIYQLIIIENKYIADSYKKQFELLWSIAKE